MQRISLTTADGYAISLRSDTIEMFQDSEGESLIRTTTGLQIAVKESAAEIDALLIAAQCKVNPTMVKDFRAVAVAYSLAIDLIRTHTTTFEQLDDQAEAAKIIDRYWPKKYDSNGGYRQDFPAA